jgi:EAL domain-containing protein (putative c-di-GMP-specific phosphodiesterase class I)
MGVPTLLDPQDLEERLFPGADGTVFAVYKDYVLRSVFEPICDRRRQPLAYEALLRPCTMSGAPASPASIFRRTPADPEARAHQVNLDRIAALMHLRNWASYRLPLGVHVNLLPSTLIGAFGTLAGCEMIGQRLEALGIARQAVVFEMSAHLLADDDQLAAATHAMRRHGFRFCLDDYGEAVAGPDRVRLLSPGVLKIARNRTQRFVQGDTQPLREALQLARSIKALTAAEGVETPLQFEVLSRAGVDLFQGYHLGRTAALAESHTLPGRAPAQAKTVVPAEMLVL